MKNDFFILLSHDCSLRESSYNMRKHRLHANKTKPLRPWNRECRTTDTITTHSWSSAETGGHRLTRAGTAFEPEGAPYDTDAAFCDLWEHTASAARTRRGVHRTGSFPWDRLLLLPL